MLLVASCGGSASQQKVVLSESGTGNATETFVATSKSGWDLHWSYDCSGHGVFVVDVFGSDRTPDFKHPGVNEEGSADSAVYHVPESGRFYLEVTSTCTWTIKVLESQG